VVRALAPLPDSPVLSGPSQERQQGEPNACSQAHMPPPETPRHSRWSRACNVVTSHHHHYGEEPIGYLFRLKGPKFHSTPH